MNIKKIIAREGIIILGFIALFLVNVFSDFKLGSAVFFVSMLGYPIYLIIRFILWAIRTLKKKE